MNLVATSDFRNQWTDKIEIEDTPHELHIPKGSRFSIGGGLPFEKLSQVEKQIVTLLNSAGRILDADTQKDKIAVIDKEIAAEKAAVEKRNKAAAAQAK